MARQGFDLQLTRYGTEGWRATFYPAGIGHSLTPMVGSAWMRAPGTAVQRAAWEALRKGAYDAAPRRPRSASSMTRLKSARWTGL